ncbi:MAG: 7-cyano-7-deazaguanine synthase [Fimbriimonadaceae bacterium]|nr:7-cyano-7-deazaguanine synthase [Fimbriimonadaceae bacterium]
MKAATSHVFLCNGADAPASSSDQQPIPTILEYRAGGEAEPNVHVALPRFVSDVNYLPPRVLDLLELAAYVYAADRLTDRGDKDAVEYHSWARSMRFVVRVRDHEFWSDHRVAESLCAALRFMSGDLDYAFEFQPGHSTPPTGLFDDAEFILQPRRAQSIILFSGGLDSLAGIFERLDQSDDSLCLVSHQSQPGTVRTQNHLAAALTRDYPGRIAHYRFECHLRGVRANEETQRTRAFLYTAIACAIAVARATPRLLVYENGVTAINFARRQDMVNARASRTVHPRTMALLEAFYAYLGSGPVRIDRPFQWKTKAEVLQLLIHHGGKGLLSSSVSCSKTFQNLGQATHCGWCSQCVDRRFAAYAASLDDLDEGGIYGADFVRQPITERDAKTMVVDYVRQALSFAEWNIDHFHDEMLSELLDVLPSVGLTQNEAMEAVYSLCQRHGTQVKTALRRMRDLHDDPARPLPEQSLLYLVNAREHLKMPVERLAESIATRLTSAIPCMFQRQQPASENDLNDKVSAIIGDGREAWEREHPSVRFAVGSVRPDHSCMDQDLWIETKYIRGSTSRGGVTEAMAADYTQYPNECHILFFVYDPERRIASDDAFRHEFERRGRCTVCVVR